MFVVHTLLAELYNIVAMLSLAPTVIPAPLAALAVVVVFANCIVRVSVTMLPVLMIFPLNQKYSLVKKKFPMDS